MDAPIGADTDAGACTEPTSADIIWIGGGIGLLIGTSSSSPEMAGVLALDVELNGRLGNVNPLIYNMSFNQTVTGALAPPSAQVFHRDIKGNNNGYKVDPAMPTARSLATAPSTSRTSSGCNLRLPLELPARPPTRRTNPNSDANGGQLSPPFVFRSGDNVQRTPEGAHLS